MIAPHYRVFWVMVMSPRNEKKYQRTRVTFLFYSSVYLKLPTHSFNSASIIYLSKTFATVYVWLGLSWFEQKIKKISTKFKESNTVKHRNYLFLCVIVKDYSFLPEIYICREVKLISELYFHFLGLSTRTGYQRFSTEKVKNIKKIDVCLRLLDCGAYNLITHRTNNMFHAPSGSDFCGIINNDSNGEHRMTRLGGLAWLSSLKRSREPRVN